MRKKNIKWILLIVCIFCVGCKKENIEEKVEQEDRQEAEEEKVEQEDRQEAEEEKVEQEEATFDEYVEETLEPELGTFQMGDYRYQYALEEYDGSQYFGGRLDQGSGMITTEEVDLDSDGEKEYLVFYLDGNAKDEKGYPQNDLVIKVYEKKSNTFEKKDEEILLEGVMDCTNRGYWKTYLVQSNDHYYICSEGYDLTYLWADGANISMSVLSYEEGDLVKHIQNSASGSDFGGLEDIAQASIELNKIGLTQSAESVSENSNYSFVPEEVGSPLIEFTAEVENPDDYSGGQILSYRDNRETEKFPFVIGKGRVQTLDEALSLKKEEGIEDNIQSEETADNVDFGGWKQLYIDYIQNLEQSDSLSYDLIYIDADEIPELLIGYGSAAGGEDVCTIDGESVQTVHIYMAGLSYLDHGNLFRDSGGHMDEYYDRIYCIKDGKIIQLHHGDFGAEDNTNVQMDENGEMIYQYFWDDQQVSKSEYEENLAAVFDEKQAVNPYDSSFYTREEIIEKIQEIID